MPLGRANRGDVDERPLAGLVVHARLRELNLQRIVGVADDSFNLGGAATS